MLGFLVFDYFTSKNNQLFGKFLLLINSINGLAFVKDLFLNMSSPSDNAVNPIVLLNEKLNLKLDIKEPLLGYLALLSLQISSVGGLLSAYFGTGTNFNPSILLICSL